MMVEACLVTKESQPHCLVVILVRVPPTHDLKLLDSTHLTAVTLPCSVEDLSGQVPGILQASKESSEPGAQES